KERLDEGVQALLVQIGDDALIVCESNSLRQVAAPDAFVMLKDAESGQLKHSARSVEKHVDRFIQFDGAEFDIDPADINIADRRWSLRRDASAVVLAGGESSRMDADKSMLPVAGKPMIQHITEQLRPHFKEVLVSANDPEKYAFLNLRVVPDEVPDQGPLMGIVSSLEAASCETLFVTACDIPQPDIALIARLLRESRDCVGAVLIRGDRKLEPLFAVYKKSAIPAAREAFACGKRRVNEIFHRCRIKPVELGEGEDLTNINTMAEYEDFRKVYDDTV
ncbi:MAG: molybdenum cofactor guanylyltransferase, partial [Planctomycetota bacterium]